MPRVRLTFLLAWAVLLAATPAVAHFVVLLPAADVIEAGQPRDLDLQLLFTHPMQQGPIMEMARPKQFGVLVGGRKTDLLASLTPRTIDGKTTYTAKYRLARPGDHVFYVEPAPYWEPSEQKLIIHYTKVVVDFLGAEEGWDAMVGLPVEIEPLTRPFGVWAGNCLRGIVKKHGKPAPFAEVEVEYYNVGKRVMLPNESFTTQVIKADAQGVFCYTMPKAGWWGFAALVTADEKMKAPTGAMVDVELGGVMWVKTEAMKDEEVRSRP